MLDMDDDDIHAAGAGPRTPKTPPNIPHAPGGNKWRAASLKLTQSKSPDPKRINIFQVLKDPQVRAEYRKREAETAGSGKMFLKLVTRKRRAEALAPSVKLPAMHGVVTAAVHQHKRTVRELLKNKWVRARYQACEKEQKGKGVVLLRELTEPGAVEKAMRAAGVAAPVDEGVVATSGGGGEKKGSGGVGNDVGARSKSQLLALVRKKKELRKSNANVVENTRSLMI
jgi:hypothetical protein